MNRRDFLRRTSLAAVAGNFDYPWNLGIITDQVDLDLSRALSSFYRKYQLRWAEIRYMNLDGRKRYVYADATPAQLKHVTRQLSDAGVNSRFSILLFSRLRCLELFRWEKARPTSTRHSSLSPAKWTI
jgi:hypothetical protein